MGSCCCKKKKKHSITSPLLSDDLVGKSHTDVPDTRQESISLPGVSFICDACRQAANSNNSIGFQGRTYHKKCFKCAECKYRLKLSTVVLDLGNDRLTCRKCNETHETTPTTPILDDDEISDQPSWLVAKEMLDTEQLYVEYITALHDCFVRPLQKRGVVSIDRNPQIAVFCYTLGEICKLNGKFLKILRMRVQDREGDAQPLVSDIFVQYSKLFTIYGQYSRNYGMFSDVVDIEEAASLEFAKLLKEWLSDQRCQRQPLESLLIMPVQRLPRYILLLKELKKKILKEVKIDLSEIDHALKELRTTTNHVNDAIRARERELEMREIQATFYKETNLLDKPDRYHIKNGHLEKLNRRNKTNHYIFHLFSDVLVYSAETPMGLKEHRRLDLHFFAVDDVPDDVDLGDREHAFLIKSAEKSFVVFADSEEDKNSWKFEIQFAIDQLSKKSVVNDTIVAPLWRTDHTQENCSICSKDFTMFNRKHHCRFCGALVDHDCSSNSFLIYQIDPVSAVRVCDMCYESLKQQEQKEQAEEKQEKPNGRENHPSSVIIPRKGVKVMISDALSLFRPKPPQMGFTILSEEQEFVDRMKTFLGYVIQPLMNELVKESNRWQFSSDKLEGDDLVKAGPTLAMICSCVEQLYTLGRRVVDDLDANLTNLTDEGFKLGTIFEEYEHYFYVHLQYSSYLPSAVTFLNTKYRYFVNGLEQKTLDGLSIQQYLDLPLQKISDLNGNLETLLHTVDLNNPNYPEISQALNQIHGIYKKIRPHILEKDNRIMQFVEEKFVGDVELKKKHRALIFEGDLQLVFSMKEEDEKTNTSSRRQSLYFHLFSDILTYSKKTALGFDLQRIISLSKLEVYDHSGDLPNSMEIKTNRDWFVVQAQTPLDKEQWLKYIRKQLIRRQMKKKKELHRRGRDNKTSFDTVSTVSGSSSVTSPYSPYSDTSTPRVADFGVPPLVEERNIETEKKSDRCVSLDSEASSPTTAENGFEEEFKGSRCKMCGTSCSSDSKLQKCGDCEDDFCGLCSTVQHIPDKGEYLRLCMGCIKHRELVSDTSQEEQALPTGTPFKRNLEEILKRQMGGVTVDIK